MSKIRKGKVSMAEVGFRLGLTRQSIYLLRKKYKMPVDDLDDAIKWYVDFKNGPIVAKINIFNQAIKHLETFLSTTENIKRHRCNSDSYASCERLLECLIPHEIKENNTNKKRTDPKSNSNKIAVRTFFEAFSAQSEITKRAKRKIK